MLNTVRAFSIASMIVSPFWFDVFRLGAPTDENFIENSFHYTQHDANHVDYMAAIILTGILAVAVFVLLRRMHRHKWLHYCMLIVIIAAFICVFSGLRLHFYEILNITNIIGKSIEYWWFSLPLTVFVGLVAYRFRQAYLRVVFTVVTIAAPLGLVLLGNGIYGVMLMQEKGSGLMTYDGRLAERVSEPPGKRRTLMVIFDAWDYWTTFDAWDANANLPEISRLRRESFFPTNAVSVGGITLNSIPGMTIGIRPQSGQRVAGLDWVMNAGPDNPSLSWRESDTIFHHAHRRRLNVSYGGTGYIPYCKLFRDAISHCVGGGYFPGDVRKSAWSQIGSVIGRIGINLPGVRRYLTSSSIDHNSSGFRETYDAFMVEATRMVADPSNGFTFMHLYLPHAMYFYDRHKRAMVDYYDAPDGYFSALVLVDKSIGALRQAMEKAGVWETTNVIFTTDHGSSVAGLEGPDNDRRIPMIIKLAGTQEGLEYAAPVDQVNLHRVLRGIFDGRISTNRHIVEALNP